MGKQEQYYEILGVKATPRQTEPQESQREETEKGMSQPDLSGGYFIDHGQSVDAPGHP